MNRHMIFSVIYIKIFGIISTVFGTYLKSHIHYKKISKIVKKTALEFNLPYNEYRTTRDAIKSHFNFLKLMGTKPAL